MPTALVVTSTPGRPLATPFDSESVVVDALKQYWPAAQRELPVCTISGDHAVVGAGLDAFDQEISDGGQGRWSPSSPSWWIGDRESAIEAFGGDEIVEISDAEFWIIEPRRDWFGPGWYAQEVRRFVTPAGNNVWVRDRAIVAFPVECPPHE